MYWIISSWIINWNKKTWWCLSLTISYIRRWETFNLVSIRSGSMGNILTYNDNLLYSCWFNYYKLWKEFRVCIILLLSCFGSWYCLLWAYIGRWVQSSCCCWIKCNVVDYRWDWSFSALTNGSYLVISGRTINWWCVNSFDF